MDIEAIKDFVEQYEANAPSVVFHGEGFLYKEFKGILAGWDAAVKKCAELVRNNGSSSQQWVADEILKLSTGGKG